MPNTLIATRTGWIGDPAAVLEAVQSALRDALRIPEWDRTLRLVEHSPSHFAIPPGRGPRFTVIEITMFAGRSIDAKRSLYRALVHNLATLGVPADDIKITLVESPPENWGIRGGKPASEVDSDLRLTCSRG